LIVEIIIKKLKGHLSKEEEILFKKWLSENKENSLTYKRLEEFNNYHGKLPDIHTLDPKDAWDTIAATLQKNKYKRSLIASNHRWLHYAAIFIGIVGSVLFYKSFDHKKVIEPKQAATAITLELSNGKTQILSQQGTSTIVNPNGKVLGKKNDGIIDYTQNDNEEKIILEYNTIHVPNGKTFKIVLSDSTLINLNSGSSLKYPIKFIKGKDREVTLTGEAFFDVRKNENSPFIVTSGTMGIRVLGTRFNISSYPEDSNQTTVLVEGSVRIYEAGTKYNQDETTLLSPGFKADWNKDLKKMSLEKVNTDLYTGWVKGKLIMKKMNFASILQRLQRHYGVRINNEYEELNDRTFTATFETETIKEVMETFTIETPFEYDINGDEIHIYKPFTVNNEEAYETKS